MRCACVRHESASERVARGRRRTLDCGRDTRDLLCKVCCCFLCGFVLLLEVLRVRFARVSCPRLRFFEKYVPRLQQLGRLLVERPEIGSSVRNSGNFSSRLEAGAAKSHA